MEHQFTGGVNGFSIFYKKTKLSNFRYLVSPYYVSEVLTLIVVYTLIIVQGLIRAYRVFLSLKK